MGTPSSPVNVNPGEAGGFPLTKTLWPTLVASDTKGNTLTHTWSFKLEPLPQVAANIFVFGSPAAQLAGQHVAGPTAALAARFGAGPVKGKEAAAAWSIESVTAGSIIITYPAGNMPTFSVGQLLCNLTPVKVQEIFYRRVLSISDDPGTHRLTLFTEDVPLTNLVQQGAASITADSVVYDTAPDGTLIPVNSFTLKRKMENRCSGEARSDRQGNGEHRRASEGSPCG